MEDKEDTFIVDENGERWITLAEKSCDRKYEPRKHIFKICFEVEYEIEYIESQLPHKHIIRTKENCKRKDMPEQVLTGEIKDFGKKDCGESEHLRKQKVKITQKELVKIKDESFPEFFSYDEKNLSRLWLMAFDDTTSYFQKHIEGELKNILIKLHIEGMLNGSKPRDKAILVLQKKEEKRLRTRLEPQSNRPTLQERKDFLNKVKKAVEKLTQNHRPINKKNLALTLFPNCLKHYLKYLSRKLKHHSLTFEEITEELKK